MERETTEPILHDPTDFQAVGFQQGQPPFHFVQIISLQKITEDSHCDLEQFLAVRATASISSQEMLLGEMGTVGAASAWAFSSLEKGIKEAQKAQSITLAVLGHQVPHHFSACSRDSGDTESVTAGAEGFGEQRTGWALRSSWE